MAIFSNPDTFKEHKQYIVLLKKALLLVKPGAEKKFLYFKQYAPFGGKKPALVLVDFDPGCFAALSKAGHKPTAEGLVSLTEQDELNFVATKNSLSRASLKKYFLTMGPGIKAVHVPPGEIEEDEGEVEGRELLTSVAPIPPTDGPSPPPSDHPLPRVSESTGAAEEPRRDRRMDRKLEHEEKEFQRRQLLARIEDLSAASCPQSHQALKQEALEKARALAKEDRFEDGGKLLDGLVAKLKTLAVRPPPPSNPPSPPSKFPAYPPPQPPTDNKAKSPPSPTLSAYMNAAKQWKSAKATAEDGVFKLKKAIMEACDPELKDALKARIDQLNSILAPIDEMIMKKIEEARSDSDDERRAGREAAIGQLATSRLEMLRKHPMAGDADKNPFGTFAIRAPMEDFLTKISTTFGG
ncbi:MAG: hypothetical protein U1F83_09720 [Verrucomicrobiota bacterium]